MSKWILAAGAAALAIVSPALADPKGNKGGGNKEQSGQVAKAQKGGHSANADRGKGSGQKMQLAQRGEAKQKGPDKVKIEARGNDKVRVARVDRDNKVKVRGVDDGVRVAKVDRGRDVRVVRVDNDIRFVPRWGVNGLHRGFVDGCPPGLAKKNNGCLPPGQAKKLVGSPLSAALRANTLSGPYRSWYRDDDNFMYRWDDDYIYRVRRDGGLIDALFPYANRDYFYYPVGAAYPMDYNFYNVPYQYQSFYPDSDDYWYRYGDGAIYQVNPTSGLIQGIAALLTGAPMAVGQPLPPAYSVYNVPLAYRPTYFDTADNWYRYNDGYIYRVDPATQLITAIISAIV